MKLKINKIYLCYFEGNQEEKYFKHFSKLLKENFDDVTIKFNKVKNLNVLQKASSQMPKVAIFDYDNNKKEFENKLKICKKGKIYIAYTSLNFDLWLLLHKKMFNKVVTNNNDYIDLIRKEYDLEKTDNIKKESNIDKIIEQINIKDIKFAIKNAEKITKNKEGKITSNGYIYYNNPSLSIHSFLKDILEKIA